MSSAPEGEGKPGRAESRRARASLRALSRPGRGGRAFRGAPEKRGVPRTDGRPPRGPAPPRAPLTWRHLWTEGRAMAPRAPPRAGRPGRGRGPLAPFQTHPPPRGDRAVEGPRPAALATACHHRSPHGARAGVSATEAHRDRLRTADVIGERPPPVKGPG